MEAWKGNGRGVQESVRRRLGVEPRAWKYGQNGARWKGGEGMIGMFGDQGPVLEGRT